MSRHTRSTLLLGAATALALTTAGLFGTSAAVADDEPTPSHTSPAWSSDTPPDNPLADAPPAPARGTGEDKPPTPGTVPALPGNAAAVGVQSGNSFSSPISVTGRYPFFQLDNTNATVQTGEPRILKGGYYLTRTQWIKWKASNTGTVYLQVFGDTTSEDVGVNVYTGTKFSNLVRVGSNDQQSLPPDGGSTVSGLTPNTAGILGLAVTAGKTYYIQVGSPSATSTGVGTARTNISVLTFGKYTPVNDNLNKAITLTLGPGATVSSNGILGGATMEAWEPYANPEDTAAPVIGSLWYRWVAPADGTATFSSCAFLDLGPSMSVWTETKSFSTQLFYGDLSHIAFDTGGYTGCNFLFGGGSVTTAVTQGTPYWIQTGETLGHWGRDVTTTVSATFDKPFINGLSKTSGVKNNIVVISGQSLTTGGTPVVRFGTKVATIVGAPTATSITVKVPAQTKKGKFYVTVTAGANVSNLSGFTYK